jgi:hypothetical protein
MHLSMLYLRLKAKKKKKDFVFPEKATEIDMRKAVINRYYRILVNASTHAILEALFATEPKEIERFLSSTVFKGKGKAGLDTEYSLSKSGLRELQSEAARQAFAKMIYETVEAKSKDLNVGKIIFEKS